MLIHESKLCLIFLIYDKKNSMLVIDIYGSPSSGKSTLATFLFSQLKMRNIKCELVTEFAKDLVWDNCYDALHDQAYLFGNQYHRLSRLEGKVDVAIVDSPLMLNAIYNHNDRLGEQFNKLVIDVAKKFNSLSYFLKPFDNSFEEIGRVHSSNESKSISCRILKMLNDENIDFKTIDHDEKTYMNIVDDVVRKMNPYDAI